MANQGEFLASETAEHIVSTPPAVSNTGTMLPPRSVGRRNRSEAWNHFTIEPSLEKKAKCNYCGGLIKFENGTSAMRNHTSRCKNNPDRDMSKRQKSVASSATKVASSPVVSKFDQQVFQDEMVKMFIDMEIPFRQVEHPSFRRFLSVVQPKLDVVSRTTLARDILKLWNIEKTKLKKFLSQHCERVCLTYDTWTSSQNLSYMCLTGHFVDNDWKLQKKVLNFCQVTNHSGKTMAKKVEHCLNGWGLTRVLSLTVDNASSNDVGIQHLKRRLITWNSLVLNGDYIHMRCCAHVLNLIVKEGLKEIDKSIEKIRAAVKYVRSSPSRLAKFKACFEQEHTEYRGWVFLYVETRWNSTYLMLDAAFKHKRTFEELSLVNTKFGNELAPTAKDWDQVRALLPFLKLFYESTLRISGSNYVTSNMYMFVVLGIGKKIRQMINNRDGSISSMGQKMKTKYEKYWGNPDKLNMLLLIALVLDPRYKMKFINWLINLNFDSDDASNLRNNVEACLTSLVEEYNGGVLDFEADSQEARLNEEGDDDPFELNQFYDTDGCDKTELDRYLEEGLENRGELDVLNWWRVNSSRFPILAKIARDLLAIPVSNVASESTFSTGGRVLDPYRSSLTPQTVEAIICTQDWLKGTPSALLANEDFETRENLEQEMNPPQDVQSTSIALDDD